MTFASVSPPPVVTHHLGVILKEINARERERERETHGDMANVQFDEKGKQLFERGVRRAQRLQRGSSSSRESVEVEGSVSGGLWDHQVDDLCKVAGVPGYAPASSVDLVELDDTRPLARVVNYSRNDEEGTHWVCLYAPNHQVVVYVDSYGIVPDGMRFRPDDAPFKRMLRSLAPSVVYQKDSLQDPRTDVCGYYCAYFLAQLKRLLVPASNMKNAQEALLRAKLPFRGLSSLQRDLLVVRWCNKNLGRPLRKDNGRHRVRTRKTNQAYVNPAARFVGVPA